MGMRGCGYRLRTCKNVLPLSLTNGVLPRRGRQLSDRGKLGEASVTHVAEEGGRILHLCDKPLAVGSAVKAVVDGVVRLDHMQQHCGEHILSYAAWKLFGANNIGFHMSEGW